MKTKSLSISILVAVAAATSAFGADRYRHEDEDAARGRIVVGERAQYMSLYDYFFNNPGKSSRLRRDPGEYYEGSSREYRRP